MGIRTRTSPSKTSTVLMLVDLLSRSGGFMPAARWSNGIALQQVNLATRRWFQRAGR
jgi:hypothetical protein